MTTVARDAAQWQRHALVAVVVVLLLGMVVTAALTPTAVASPVASTPARTGCPVAAPTTAAGFQRMFDARNDLGWSGGDQAASLRLPDGRTLWVFGDTVLGREAPDGGYAPGARMVHNSFLLQDRGCLAAVNGPHGGEVVPDARNGDYYWPLAATHDAGRLVVTVARVRRTGPGALDFRGVGTEAAVFRLAPRGTPRFERMAPLPSTGAPEVRPQYGHALVVDRGHTYVYASRKVREPLVFGKAVTVARVPAGRLLDLRQWRYWDGRSWSPRPSDAADVVPAGPSGWSTSFSVLRRPGGRFQYVTKADDFLGTAVVSGTAASPQGAFTRVAVASYPSFRRPHEVLYNPLAHPEQRLSDGSLLVSISRNTTDFALTTADADRYKPQFFAVPWL